MNFLKNHIASPTIKNVVNGEVLPMNFSNCEFEILSFSAKKIELIANFVQDKYDDFSDLKNKI
ncbi:MAG: hypothetical protein HOC24_10410 [Deltaproteobacteria bacterium]|nr:hypothetical protein [Deltaproteobacteria bacterium]